jgi:hypothetical protein
MGTVKTIWQHPSTEDYTMNTGLENLSNIDRLSRMLLGYALIGVAYFHGGFLGLISLLPLVAIYPMMTAAVGLCPIEGAFKKAWNGAKQQPKAVRVASGHIRRA